MKAVILAGGRRKLEGTWGMAGKTEFGKYSLSGDAQLSASSSDLAVTPRTMP